MKIKFFTFCILLITSLASLSYVRKDISPKLHDKTSLVNFYQGNYDDFLREAKKQHKPILLDFWATWCGPCKKLDEETFMDEKFSQYVNDNFMVYRIDIDTFDGMEIADRFAVDAYPTVVMLDAKNKYINRFRGFFPASYLQRELQKNKDIKGRSLPIPKEKMASK